METSSTGIIKKSGGSVYNIESHEEGTGKKGSNGGGIHIVRASSEGSGISSEELIQLYQEIIEHYSYTPSRKIDNKGPPMPLKFNFNREPYCFLR
jgi:hypothetical protein